MNAIVIVLLHIGGNLAFSFAGAEQIRQYVEAKIATEMRRGVSVRLQEIPTDPCPGDRIDFDDMQRRLVCYRQFAQKQRLVGKRQAIHVLTSPANYRGKRYMVGAARRCDYSGASFSTAEFVNSDGVGRVPHSYAAAAHEIAHALGAYHDESAPNLMHSNVLAFAANNLGVNEKSRREINRCSRRNL